jgi:hypothetical protein
MLPAYVTAEAALRPDVGTLELVAQPDGSLAAAVHRGAGTALDEQSTLVATATEIGDELAVLAGNLAARSGFDPVSALQSQGISFVLLAEAPPGAATATRTRAADSLDSNDLFVAVGETDKGYLWRYTGDVVDVIEPTASPLQLIVFGVVFGATALLAIPTGTRRRSVAASSGDENPADTFEEDENA